MRAFMSADGKAFLWTRNLETIGHDSIVYTQLYQIWKPGLKWSPMGDPLEWKGACDIPCFAMEVAETCTFTDPTKAVTEHRMEISSIMQTVYLVSFKNNNC